MSRKTQVAAARSTLSGKTREICIFDRRFQHSRTKQEQLETSGLDWKSFHRTLCQTFSVPPDEDFVLVTTERRVLEADDFLRLKNGATLYMLRTRDQALEMPTEELINFTPHHDTVVESGTFKYYDSEGKKSLPYALADLVDNSLTATANNTRERRIEIRMMFDDSLGKPAVIVLDNGCGMTCKQLNNWAVYKLSKFTRDSQSDQQGYIRPAHLPRSLNSDISYFGVGGKQAAFYIGKATRMISKSITSPDVHELVLSKSLFERKEKFKEDTYSTTILNRRPGDFAHINKSQEQFLQNLIAEERNKESFTAVVITEVVPEHIDSLKDDFDVWTRQLAHIYHYYIHGIDGNVQKDVPEATNSDSTQKIDIVISLKTKGRDPRVINLRNINTDMQSQYIKTAVSTFEFKACTNPDVGIVEGILRYHPFLYEAETYPEDPDTEPDHPGGDDDDANDEIDYMNDSQAKKRKKPIFECFWNGRLIPYTTISHFDWCSQPPKGSKVPLECYNRVSGVLFTDDTFKVTENKLTFIDLEKKLKNKDTAFTFIVRGQRQRTNLQRDFNQWLCDCHEQFDKQVKFMNYQGPITRTDIPTKRKQQPWAAYSSVDWHGRVYEAGQLVKTQKTIPIYYGTVKHFLFYGNPDGEGDVYAPGGQVEICLEPKGLHDSTKIVQLSKLDRNATIEEIKKRIERDSEKLPSRLKVEFPKENEWEDNSTQLAGTVLGPIQVQILNKKGESISRISSVGPLGRKLSVELKLVLHADQEIFSAVAHHSAKWGFWFKEIEHLVELGEYTLHLRTILTDTSERSFGERRLPHYKLGFAITEGKAVQFDVGAVSSSLRVGVPFDIPLHMKDIYGHPVNAISDLKATVLCSGLDIKYERIKCEGKILRIKNVTAKGKLKSCLEPNPYDLCVTLEGLKDHSKILRINLLPGVARVIHVIPKDDPIHVENGNTVQFTLIVQDEIGNTTAHPKLTAQCLVPEQPPAAINCLTGVGNHVTKPIKVSIVQGEPQRLKVNFIPKSTGIKEVVRNLLVLPSTQVHRMELYIQDGEPLMLKNGEKVQYVAGGVLENLYFRLYDEANTKVEVTPAVASKLKANWIGKMNEKELIECKLPDVQIPTKAGEEYYRQVSFQDQNVSFSFTIVPIPDQAEKLKATVPKCTARLGECFPEPIILELIDQHSNVTNTLEPSCVNQISAEGEGLDKTHLNYKVQKNSCSVLVTGVCFKAGTPGSRDICFTYKNFTCSVKLKVTAGVPAQLNLVKGPKQPLQILNGKGIPTPFVIQLCDQWNNPSPDQRVVVKMCPSPEIKVNAEVLSQPVDVNGQASFKVLCVSGPKGYYQLKFETSFKKESIRGPSVNLTVLPDPDKPVSLKVLYDTNVSFIAGKLFPVFSVTVMSDEGSPITRFNIAAVSMLCWKGGLTGKKNPADASEFQCNKPLDNEDKRAFYFREKPIPEDAAKYTVQFCLREDKDKNPLYSEQIVVNVEADKPVKLAPDSPPPARVVSYCHEIDKRILLENLTLKIVDQYGNPAGEGLNGQVDIYIKNLNSESREPHPLFEGKTNCHKVKLIDGRAAVERLAVMKNSPGKHAATYVVVFTPLLSTGHPEPLMSYEFQFSFSHDAQNQEERQKLTRKRDEIKKVIRASMDKVQLHKGLITEFNVLLKNNSDTLMGLRNQLAQRNLHLPSDVTVQEVNDLIYRKSEECRQIKKSPRRTCQLDNNYQNINEDILGRVGFLALVEDDAAAWVISWHIRGDMNCVVTTTQRAAMDIHHRTKGTQELMPLDNIFNHRPPGPLPHIIKRFPPVGNPVYAIDVLIYPHKEELKRDQCKTVFRNILGNTILIDDLDSANEYRRLAVMNHMQCPTIITRSGQRLTGKGKFGGTGNNAPPRDQLAMFGAPLPNIYYYLEDDIKLLVDFKKAFEKNIQDEAEYNKVRSMPEIQDAEETLRSKNRELEETERQLGTPVHSVRRVSPSAGEPSGVPAKRSKSGY